MYFIINSVNPSRSIIIIKPLFKGAFYIKIAVTISDGKPIQNVDIKANVMVFTVLIKKTTLTVGVCFSHALLYNVLPNLISIYVTNITFRYVCVY